MKITHVRGLADGAGQLAQRLGHQPGLQPHVGIPHFAFDLGSRHQRRHRIDDQHIDGTAADQHVGNLQRLFAGVRLGNQQVVAIDAQFPGIYGVQGVLGIDKGGDAALPLGLGHGMQGQRGFAG